MAGIYLHVPFCKQACHYCNFHFSTSMQLKDQMLAAMLKEIELRGNYLDKARIETIYFGGGTPSLLSLNEIDQFLKSINASFDITENPEITLEANPDDLSKEKIKALADSPINRISLGVQSFFNEELLLMNRSHNVNQALESINMLSRHGFKNITIDLIYGTPTLSIEKWKKTLKMVFDLKIPHISAYALTIEPKTAMYHFVKTGKISPAKEDTAAEQFEILMEMTAEEGYDHYEISNFGQPGFYSQHNSSYWKNKKYLGIGPSAHSYDGESRQWNIAHNPKYINKIQQREDWFRLEELSAVDRYNEYIMIRLRTSWGCELKEIEEKFRPYFLGSCQEYIDNGHVVAKNGNYSLTTKGKLIADRIASELFWVE